MENEIIDAIEICKHDMPRDHMYGYKCRKCGIDYWNPGKD